MFICELIPLKTVKTIQTLTYYSMGLINVGALVEIDMHGQKLEAIVIHNYEALDAKLILKNKDFALKKIKTIINPSYISSTLLIELRNIALNNLTTINNLLNTLIKLEDLHSINLNQINTERSNTKQKEKLEKENNKHIKHKYISNLEFNNLILTQEDFILTSTEMDKIKAKQLNHNIKKNIDTVSLKFLVSGNVKNIFIYNSNNRNYYSNFKEVNTKNIITEIAQLFDINVYYVSDHLSLSDFKTKKEMYEIKFNKNDNKEFTLLHMKENPNPYLNDSLLNLIKNNINENKKILIYTNRVGLYTSSVCADCGTKISCPNCEQRNIKSNLILKKNKQNINFYSCNKCLTSYDLPNFDNSKEAIQDEYHNLIKCSNCNSWRIETLGIGLEGLDQFVEGLFPDKALLLDSNTHNTPNKINTLIKNNLDKNIFICNEFGLTLLPEEFFDTVIISSIDSLFNIPEFNIDEEIFYLTRNILSKSKIASRNFLQTRLNIKYINLFLKNDENTMMEFYKNELSKREQNNLSPYFEVVTFDLPDNSQTNLWTPPNFLSSYNNIKIKLKVRNIFKPKIIENIIRFIYFIPTNDWNTPEKSDNMKEFLVTNFTQFNLKLNPSKIWE